MQGERSEKMDFMNIVIQGIGVLGILASILSFQCKKHNRLMALRTANELLFAIQYGLLGAYTGLAMNLIGCVRNTVFTEMVKRNKSTMLMRYLFSGAFVLFTILTWDGYKSILSGFAKVVSTFAYGSPNTKLVRALILLTSSCWFFYNLLVRSYAGVACETFTIISILVGIIRLDIRKKGKASGEESLQAAEKAGQD